MLERAGLAVTRGAYDLPTAFDARVGTEGPQVAVLCEYDALPGIGHACGHNIIAAAGLGAALALAPLADELGGRLAILGTPAEEGGGGKVFMIERGAFAGVDAAMMVHPAGAELRSMQTLAIHQVLAEYRGRAAHAAAAPWRGRERARRRWCSATTTSPRCASTSGPTSASTASSPRRATSRTSSPTTPRRTGTCARATPSTSRC